MDSVGVRAVFCPICLFNDLRARKAEKVLGNPLRYISLYWLLLFIVKLSINFELQISKIGSSPNNLQFQKVRRMTLFIIHWIAVPYTQIAGLTIAENVIKNNKIDT